MDIEQIINLCLNSSVSIACVAFFMYRDLKFMNQLQVTLQALIDTVNSLKEVVERNNKDE